MSASGEPDMRRDTPLAARIARRITTAGPLPVRDYMAMCLSDPQHGYYRARPVLGSAGDFVTAPEITQVFGELLGLWSAVVWQQMGAPSPFQLVEVGPGRGTMMADALRAAGRVAGFAEAVRVRLVEPSPVLRAQQKQTLGSCAADVTWLADLGEIATAPTVLLANEFIDVIPVTQLERGADGWHERAVVLDGEGRLAFGAMPSPWSGLLPAKAETAASGALLELRDLAGVVAPLARVAKEAPFAALFIDYGHEATGFGDTLQAVRKHRSEHPLASPGEADLTAMVDFEATARAFRDDEMAVEKLVTQAEFLGALGIAERASRLMAANPLRAGEIETGVARLMSPQGMGTRFKVLGVRGVGMATLPGFPPR